MRRGLIAMVDVRAVRSAHGAIASGVHATADDHRYLDRHRGSKRREVELYRGHDITSAGAETNYPELNCGGKLKRVGSANGYAFYMETITRGGKNSGGSCIDGAVTVAPAGANLAWGWVGSYGGKVYVAWSDLVRK